MTLWIPGPTEVRAELLAECARPMIGHRSAAMSELIARLDPHLRHAFGVTAEDTAVAAHTCSATGLMEASLIGAGPRVLCLVCGAFSKRWSEVARGLGKNVVVHDVEWGSAPDPAEVERILRADGPFDAVTAVINETSTGVATPLGPLAAAVRGASDALLMIDVVSYLAGAAIDFDAHGVDFALAGSQKALALPPGVAVCAVSARYLERARAREQRGYYLDPVRIVEGHQARKTPSTPCIPLYYALARQLEDISAGTVEEGEPGDLEPGAPAWRARFERHGRMRAATHAWVREQGLELFPSEELASPTVSCVRADGWDVGAFVAGLAERGMVISNGYGPLKGKTFRIGHMGDHTEEALRALLDAASEVLAALR